MRTTKGEVYDPEPHLINRMPRQMKGAAAEKLPEKEEEQCPQPA